MNHNRTVALVTLVVCAALGSLLSSCAVAPYFERARVSPGPAAAIGVSGGIGAYSAGEAPSAWEYLNYSAVAGVLQLRYGLSEEFGLGLDGTYGLASYTKHDSAETHHLSCRPFEAKLAAKLALSEESALHVGVGYGRADRFYVPFDVLFVRDFGQAATVYAGVESKGVSLGAAIHHPIAGPLTGHLAAKAAYMPFNMANGHLSLGYAIAAEPR